MKFRLARKRKIRLTYLNKKVEIKCKAKTTSAY